MGLTISLIQMDITFGNPQANYERVTQLFKEFKANNADVVLLPELWTTGYDLTRLHQLADDGKESIGFISKLAKQYQTNIIAGSIAKKVNDSFTNTLFVVNQDGQLVKEYNKAHLFRLMDEDKHLIEGNGNGNFELAGIKALGLYAMIFDSQNGFGLTC